MESIHISGGTPLSGEVRIHGAKNAALPILTAAAGISGLFALRRCPCIRDIEVTREILRDLGVTTEWEGDTLLVDSRGRRCVEIRSGPASAIRTSSLLLGVMTGAWGRAEIPAPGGCNLGSRVLDLHMEGFSALGVSHSYGTDTIRCSGKPTGGSVFLRYPSVGATENLMLLAALGAPEPVQIIGAAREPEVADLAAFLNACGGQISGAGSTRIEIRPAPLHGAEHTILPDRMETATYLCAGACTGGSVSLIGARPDSLRPVLDLLRKAGCTLTEAGDRLTLEAGRLQAVGPVCTGPYPAFPTDAQPLISAVLTTAEGLSLVEDAVFPVRFGHVPGLQAMGADMELVGSTARIRGVDRLHGAEVRATDLRAGAALLCAALGADGETLLTNARYLDRGYQDLVPVLRSLGARLEAAD